MEWVILGHEPLLLLQWQCLWQSFERVKMGQLESGIKGYLQAKRDLCRSLGTTHVVMENEGNEVAWTRGERYDKRVDSSFVAKTSTVAGLFYRHCFPLTWRGVRGWEVFVFLSKERRDYKLNGMTYCYL